MEPNAMKNMVILKNLPSNLVKEAEMVIQDYIAKIEKKEYEINSNNKKLKEKYKRLKALTAFLLMFSMLSLFSMILR